MNRVYKKVADKIVEHLQEIDAAKWDKPWFPMKSGLPTNVVTGKAYRGINIFLLMAADSMGFASKKQWESKGCEVLVKKKDAHIAIFYTKWEKEDDETGEKTLIPVLRYYPVYDCTQVKGEFALRANPIPKLNEHTAIESAETQLNDYLTREKIKLKTGDRAFYRPSTDEIMMPRMGQFESAESFYSTLAHEEIHSTGAKTRLDREIDKAFNDKSLYAYEELVAEFGAAMICASLGISQEPRKDHANYIKHWIKGIKDKPQKLISAAAAAQRAADMVLDR